VELRDGLSGMDDLVVLYVLASNQVNPKTHAFIRDHGLADRVRFLVDRESATIDALGLRRPDPEPVEVGVPEPATYLIDREGVVRFADVRHDFQIWLDPAALIAALQEVP
jgi:peroxiredoxin